MEDKKVLLQVDNVSVKFKVRGRELTAIRGISLDIYENESIAIVGESGSGKSVFTKTFAGMLDSNGYISNGRIIFNDEELADTVVPLTSAAAHTISSTVAKLDSYSKYELGASIYREMKALEAEKNARGGLSAEELKSYSTKIAELKHRRTEAYNLKLTLESKKDAEQIAELNAAIKQFDVEIKAEAAKEEAAINEAADRLKHDTEYLTEYNKKMDGLKAAYDIAIEGEVSEETKARNVIIAKEIYLTVGRYNYAKRIKNIRALIKAVKNAMIEGVDLDDENARNDVFDQIAFRVKYLDEIPAHPDTPDDGKILLHGTCILNLANVRNANDWTQIRGTKIATVFQDPMTSLNPIITIGKQITSVIMKHQDCTEGEARVRAMELMKKVGIPNAESRFDDYPFQYSGGMRQRIVIAIALSCQPKILICDEPTTALDVTIQAQILNLLKDLQKEFNYTIVFITHDLGVVANIADRVAVLYAGQIVELASVRELFYDPRHPYTWALLSSLPQLAQKDTKLYSITGTPPSLYNSIEGDAFAPRNPYCMKIDTLKEPPMFKVSDTHYAKTWLLDERAPKIEKPEIIQDIHEKLIKAFNI